MPPEQRLDARQILGLGKPNLNFVDGQMFI
jgi:hypothetical protein